MNWQSQVFLYDALAEPTALRMTLLSRRTDGVVADGSSYYAAPSADGRFVAFMTAAANWRRPRRPKLASSSATVLADRSRVDVIDAARVRRPVRSIPSISADGTAIAFSSDARNTINWFNFGSNHVFVVTAFAASPASASIRRAAGRDRRGEHDAGIGWNAVTTTRGSRSWTAPASARVREPFRYSSARTAAASSATDPFSSGLRSADSPGR